MPSIKISTNVLLFIVGFILRDPSDFLSKTVSLSVLYTGKHCILVDWPIQVTWEACSSIGN